MSTQRQEQFAAAVERLRLLDLGDATEDKVDLQFWRRSELRSLFEEGLGEKPFRADQVFDWIYKRLVTSFDEMTNLSKPLRARLERVARLMPLDRLGAFSSPDGTTKFTFRCDDKAVIESVLIPFATHNSLCISSQVGCAMGCTFCYTAKMGLRRNLTSAEIVAQVVAVRRMLAERDEKLTNIVFMGMGEPFHNLENVLAACDIVIDEHGMDFSRRRVTVSTSGIVPAIERFAEESDAQLAVSLNATTDAIRTEIMPVNERWDIQELLSCLRKIPLDKRRRITFEYVLLAGVNDSDEDADRLADLIGDIPNKVNIIAFNPHPDTPFVRPNDKEVERFQNRLIERHVSCFWRRTRGAESMAACGQLGQPGDRKEPLHVRSRLERMRKKALGD
jgi:23S rRNA (adenine2503-C2)-methyltransferase